MKKFEFRRQFITGSRFFGDKKYWQHIFIRENLKLSVHKNLSVCQAQKDNKRIILLGYMIDPFHTDRTNSDIVKWLANQSSDFSDIIKHTYDFDIV